MSVTSSKSDKSEMAQRSLEKTMQPSMSGQCKRCCQSSTPVLFFGEITLTDVLECGVIFHAGSGGERTGNDRKLFQVSQSRLVQFAATSHDIASMEAFVTVGTTKFDALVEALDTDACLSALVARGFTSLRLQIGHGQHEPRAAFPGLELSWYRHDPQYKRDVQRADLVISHAGAGSIMDSLALKKKLVVVVNTQLMDNHQTELAEAMAEHKYCLQTSVQGLQEVLETGDWSGLQDYPQPDEQAFPDLVDAVVGVDVKQLDRKSVV